MTAIYKSCNEQFFFFYIYIYMRLKEDPKNTFGRKKRTMEEEEGMGWNKGRRKKAHFCSLLDYV